MKSEFYHELWRNKHQAMVFRHLIARSLIDYDSRVLDIGCGDGLLMKKLVDLGCSVMGVDISQEAVKKCEQKNLQVKKLNFAAEPLPFADNQFDYALLLDVLEHLYDPLPVISEAGRVARKIIISVPNFNSLPARLHVLFGRVPENNLAKKGHVFWFNFQNLKEIIRCQNYQILALETNTFWENIFVLGSILKIAKKYFPSVFALSFVVMIKENN